MAEPELVIVADAAAGAVRAAALIADALHQAVGDRGRADWATTGGSTISSIYRAFLEPPVRGRIPWDDVHTWWGDDRFVPSDHPLSNVKPFDDILMRAGAWESVHSDDPRTELHIPVENVHPFRTGEAIGTGRDAGACSSELAAELRGAGLAEADGWPVFDLVVLGVGGDGHVLSVFPGSAAFDSRAWAVAVPAPTHIEPHVQRVTMNPAIIGTARRVVVVANGAGKAGALGHVFGDQVDARQWPARLARRDGATWVVDEAAAANLPR